MRIYTRTELEKKCGVEKLRDIMRDLGRKPRNLNKNQLIESILLLQDGKMQPENSNFGRKPRTENDNNNIKYMFNNIFIITTERGGKSTW